MNSRRMSKNYLMTHFMERQWKNERNRLRLEFLKKDDTKNIIKQQSNPTFNGIHRSYEKSDSYRFKQNAVIMDERIYLGFTLLEISELHMSETY